MRETLCCLFLKKTLRADVINAFNSTSRYLDDLLNFDIPILINWIYPTELKLNRANSFNTKAPFVVLGLSKRPGKSLSIIYNKRDYFHFEIINFPFLVVYVPAPLLMVYIFRSLFVLQKHVQCLKKPKPILDC